MAGSATGTPESRVRPAQLSGDLQLQQIGAGLLHTCAVTTGNVAYCWGANGRIGDGTTGNRLFPTPVAGPS